MGTSEKTKLTHHEVIGLIPVSDEAKRLSPLPCSKELLPIGFRSVKEHKEMRPKVVGHYLLAKMKIADITKAYIIVWNGKWDIDQTAKIPLTAYLDYCCMGTGLYEVHK